MEKLFEYSNKKLSSFKDSYKRYMFPNLSLNNRLSGIKGARGTGKSTLMLQLMNDISDKKHALYISMDHFYFADKSLIETAESFAKMGGKYLFVDEVHKYNNWARDLKNIYDFFDDIHVVFSGSSALEILKGNVDLSRRAIIHRLHEMSLREYLLIHKNLKIETFSLEDILSNHDEIARKINKKIKPLKEFNEYLKYGAYPFINEGVDFFYDKLQSIIRLIIENDLPAIYPIEYKTTVKLEKLLVMLTKAVPFKPNISDLSKNLEVSRNTLLQLLDFLHKARLINTVNAESSAGGMLSKPDKVFLNNTTLHYALNNEPNTGTARETFFVNQLSLNHKVNISKKGDFIIDNKYTFEIGGQNKSFKQISNIENSFVAADNIEFGIGNKIPLWLFGFLY